MASKITPVCRVRYRDLPSHPDFSNLWANRIATLEQLLEVAKHDETSFLALDSEFIYMTDLITEIGLAYCPGWSQERAEDVSLNCLVQRQQLQAQVIKIHERQCIPGCSSSPWEERKLSRPQETFRFGREVTSNLRYLKGTISSYMSSLRPEGQLKRIVLVGYAMNVDLHGMCSDFPSIAHRFSAWVDLRSIIHTVVAHPARLLGLGGTLEALGYSTEDIGDPPLSKGQRHSSGNDAVRTLAVLDSLLASAQNHREPSKIDFLGMSGLAGIKFTSYAGPGINMLPFTATVRAVDAPGLPAGIDLAVQLGRFVCNLGYNPTHVGAYGTTGRQWTSADGLRGRGSTKKHRIYGWISLPSLRALEAFIEEAKGMSVNGVSLDVSAVLDCKETSRKYEEAHAVRQLKRQEREQAQNMTSDALDSGFTLCDIFGEGTR